MFIVVNVPLLFPPVAISNCLIPGEDDLSFAYDGRGKKVSGGKEEAFGELLSEGDIIGCYAVSDTFLISPSFIWNL